MKYKNAAILAFIALFSFFFSPPPSFAKYTSDGLTAEYCSGNSIDSYAGCGDSGCHTTYANNSGSGNVSVAVKSGGSTVTGYTGGQSYTVEVTITHSGATRWGFQTSSRKTSSMMHGTFTADDVYTEINDTQVLKLGVIQGTCSANNATGCKDGSGPVTYSFTWTAPAAGTGTVTLYTAALAANGSGTELGDYPYTTTTTLTEGGTTKTLSSIAASASSSTLTSAGATSTITTTATYSDSSTATVTGTSYTSSNESVATVSSSGIVTAVANGTTTITVSYTEGGVTKTATVDITVSITAAKTLSSIAASASSSTLTSAGATSTITTTATYSDSSTATVTPTSTSSSDETVATVSGSTITAVGSGTATITVSYTEGGVTKTATVDITVSIAAQPPTITSFTPTSGASGANIVITGTNFISGATVKFGDYAADTVTVDSSTQITAKVRYGLSGKITVTTAGGTAISSQDFAYTLSLPLEIPSVPTLGEWGNILLALTLILAAGYFTTRKRKGLGC